MNDDIRYLEAGPYKLVARFHKGTFRSVLWSGGKVVFEAEGTLLDEVTGMGLAHLAELQADIAAARNGAAPTVDEATAALKRLHGRLNDNHLAMLRAHVKAAGHQITATQLADAAGYKSYSAANLQYGLVGAMLLSEMPEALPKRPDGTPILTCAIASGEYPQGVDEAQWVWTMRPHIVAALKASGIV